MIGHITMPLQTNSAHRAPDMAGVQCYFGSFFIYKYNKLFLSHISMIPVNFIWVYNNKVIV